MVDIVKALAASTEVQLGNYPFGVGQMAIAETSTASCTIYGVNHPGVNTLRQGGGIDTSVSSSIKYQRITLDGSTTSWDEGDYSALANLHDDSGSLTDANRLRVVVREIGVGGIVQSIYKRVQSDTSGGPGAGEFLVKTVSGSGQTLEIGAAGSDGEMIEVWIMDAADIDSTTITEDLATQLTCNDVVVASQASRLIGVRY
jgi:hypothetical protein